MTKKTPSLEAKKAYFAKVRRSNYEASLRLEGFATKSGTASSKAIKQNNRKSVKA